MVHRLNSNCLEKLGNLMGAVTGHRVIAKTKTFLWKPFSSLQFATRCRVRPIPCWRPIPDTIGRSCTDTDTGGTWGERMLHNVAHTEHTFQNITPLTLCFEMFETNYRLETTGTHATVLTVETGKWTTGIGADTKISIGRYRYSPILASIGRYPIPVSV